MSEEKELLNTLKSIDGTLKRIEQMLRENGEKKTIPLQHLEASVSEALRQPLPKDLTLKVVQQKPYKSALTI